MAKKSEKVGKGRGGAVSLVEKVDLVEIVMRGGTGAEWATKHGRGPDTPYRLLGEDAEVRAIVAAAERGQEQRFAAVIEKAYQIAMDPDHTHWGTAANFLAKVHGRYKPEKVAVTVDRVAYTDPDALAKLSAAIDAKEARPN